MAQQDNKSTTGQKGFEQNKKPQTQHQREDKQQTPEQPERWSEDSDDVETSDDDARGPVGSRRN